MVRPAFTTAALLVLLAQLLGSARAAQLERRVELAPTDKVVVRFFQRPAREVTHEIRQTLCTESVVDAQALYSSRSADQLTKVIETEEMQVLVDALATRGILDHARAEPVPNASAWLTVAVNGKDTTWSRWSEMPDEERPGFVQAWTAFLDVFNATRAYHAGTGGADFEQQQKDLDERWSRVKDGRR